MLSCDTTIMEIKVGGRSVRARLMSEENPEVVKLVSSQLPLTSFTLHTNVSGKGIVLPTTIVYAGPGHMVDRHPGTIYLFGQGQSIVITYGETFESARVNKFAQVVEEDLLELEKMGKAVFDNSTLADPVLTLQQQKVLRATVCLIENDNSVNGSSSPSPPPPARPRPLPLTPSDGRWKSVEAIFLAEARQALVEEPEEITMCFAGVIPSGMGTTSGNVLPVWMHQWCCLMTDGPSTLHRFLCDAEIPNMTLSIILRLTRNHLFEPFNHFHFLNDLGLSRFKAWGDMYAKSLDDLNDLREYKQLTS